MCQAYHWSYRDAMKMTVPQMMMLNHASWVNGKRIDSKSSSHTTNSTRDEIPDDPFLPEFNKRMSQLTADELNTYYGSF